MRHELVRLAGLIDWRRFDEAFGTLYAENERFGKVKLPLLRRFSGVGTGTPPHDTLGDIFALDFEAFQNGFAWAARCASTSTGWSGTRRSRLSRRARSRLCGGNGQSGAGRAAADKFTAGLPASEPLSALLRCSDASSTNRKGPHRGQDCDGALGRRFGARNLGCAAGRRRASAG